MDRIELIATSAFGLEAIVSRELSALGYNEQVVEDGRVAFMGDALAICRTNLWLRSADRVLVKVGAIPARDFGELFDGSVALPWDRYLPVDAKFPVTGKSVRSLITAVPSVQGVTKKSIAESLKRTHQRHWFQENGPEFPVEVSLLRDTATFSIDTSGDGLHKRGYRDFAGAAPLKETLAAALVQLSYWHPERTLWDPFCGSGTIPIEAALIGRNRAPGLGRTFLAETWPWIPRELWKQARDEARELEKPGLQAQIQATDINPKMIAAATKSARGAGVTGDINFRELDVLELKSSREYGVIICNPPYGERLGDHESAEAIYDDMSDAFEPLKTWSVYVMTSHPGFERCFRRRADRRRKLYNGRIECTYYQFYGPRPPNGFEFENDERPIWTPAPAPEITAPPVDFAHDEPAASGDAELR